MISLDEKRIEADILVIGTGGAGCFSAIRAHDRGAKVIMVNKVPWLGGCTMMGRAGYSAAFGISDPRDNPDIHCHDSVRGGDYMGNEKVLKTMCRENVRATRDLIKWGAAFKKRPDGKLDQGSIATAGHLYPRFVTPTGGLSHIGKVIMDALQSQVNQRGIQVIGNVMITNLLTSQGSVAGAVGLDWRAGTFLVFNAKAVVMATGGQGRLFKYTDNPTYMTGDGHAAMYRAGAELVDMEFCDFQFGTYYPPKMFGYPPNVISWLEHGGMLLNQKGERFFSKYFPDFENEGECLRTDISRAAACEILDGRGSPHGMVYLNCSPVPREWMMTARSDIVSHFKRAGIDITWQPMEVAPGLHTYLGGLRIDEYAESTKIKGLYAGGEAAGGWGGANRLNGNAISSALGLGCAAGKSAAERRKDILMPKIVEDQVDEEKERIQELLARKEGVKSEKVKKRVQELMQKNVWFNRNEKGLDATLAELKKLEKNSIDNLYIRGSKKKPTYLLLREALEAINMVQCGRIITSAALTRKESRGSHHRIDYPSIDNRNWLKNIIIHKEGGEMKIRTTPVVVTQIPLPGN